MQLTVDPRVLLDLDAAELGAWHPRAALCLAEHAAAAYLGHEEWCPLAAGAGYDEYLVTSGRASQVGLAAMPGLVVVCPRGSSERLDWVEDLLVLRRRPPAAWQARGRVHMGFLRQVTRLEDDVVEWVRAQLARLPGSRVVLAGHSLGAAQVPLYVVALRAAGVLPSAAYCFGMPRTGDGRWAGWYDAAVAGAAQLPPPTPTFRVVLALRGVPDIVTRVPPSRWGYWHLGRPVVLFGDARVVEGRRLGRSIDDGELRWERLRRAHPVGAIAAWRVLSRLHSGIGHHGMRGVVEQLRQVVDREERRASRVGP